MSHKLQALSTRDAAGQVGNGLLRRSEGGGGRLGWGHGQLQGRIRPCSGLVMFIFLFFLFCQSKGNQVRGRGCGGGGQVGVWHAVWQNIIHQKDTQNTENIVATT